MDGKSRTASFGYWVRRRRKALDLTQTQLAKLVNCATVTIVKIERDERRPSRELAELLASHLGLSATEHDQFVAAGTGEIAIDRLPFASVPIEFVTSGKDGNGKAVRSTKPLVRRRPISPLNNLPPQATPFVGRQRELADILRRLRDPTCRLLTLIGPGGIGKSRLAIEAASILSESDDSPFAGGVCFVQLAPIDTYSGMIAAIANATHFAFYSEVPSEQQLLNYLINKALLLVLDNLEHLLPPKDDMPTPDGSIWLLAQILDAAPAVKILVTSRSTIHLQQAWFHPVDGMELPPKHSKDVDTWKAADAVRLFIECGRRARVGFGEAPDYVGAVQICRLVAGMPLAIELAASWLKTLECARIAAEIERGLALLATPAVNIPARHRSIRAVFDYSWQLLDQAERSVMMRLSLCRGFDLNAAAQITGASIAGLTALVDKSLLRSPVAERYEMHELVRQYAAEQLDTIPSERKKAAMTHSTYYLHFLARRESLLNGAEQPRALAEIEVEIDNVHTAWHWATKSGLLNELAGAIESCYVFHRVRSRLQEGLELFGAAADRLRPMAYSSELAAKAVCALTIGQSVFALELGQVESPSILLEGALHDAVHLHMDREIVRCRHYLGELAARHNNRFEAERHWKLGLSAGEQIGDNTGRAEILQALANNAIYEGTFEVARQYAQDSLVASQFGQPSAIAHALDKLAYVLLYLGEYARSERLYREGYDLFEKLGDRLGLSLTAGGIALAMAAQGEHRRQAAFELVEESTAIAIDIGHRFHIATRLATHGQIANTFGEYLQAISVCHDALVMARVLDNSLVIQLSLSGMGYAHCCLGDLAAARHALRTSLEYGVLLPTFVVPMTLIYCGILRLAESRHLEERSSMEALRSALTLVLFAARQQAITYEFKEKATHLQVALETALAPEEVDAAHALADKMTLLHVIAALE